MNSTEKAPITDSKAVESEGHNIDWFIFGTGSGFLVTILIWIISFPDFSSAAIDSLYEFVTTSAGVFYVIAAISVLGFLLWLAFSRYGQIVFGDVPEPIHSNFAWVSMLFCAGIGASVIYWGASEWALYYMEPPFGITPQSDQAITWAASYGIFHWGPIGWAFYTLPAIALGCSYHIKKIPALRLSAACEPILRKQVNRWPGRCIDLFFLVGVVATSATGLGFGTSLVSSAVTQLTGISDGIGLQILIILTATGMIAFSVFRGLEKGIKVLSTFNLILSLILIAFVFLFGPTVFILEMGVVSLGTVVSEFVTMLTWTDPMQRADFVESWTVFYWAWWLAMGPFIGMFICKISEGRTVRQVIFGALGWGSLGCALFFIVLGNYALHLELTGAHNVVEEAIELSPSSAIASIIALLPLGSFWVFFLAVIGLIFMATTYDSASYTLAAGATKELREHQHPARWHRVFWAFALGLLPVSLLFVGGLRELQTASLVASIPLIGIYIILAISIVRVLDSVARS